MSGTVKPPRERVARALCKLQGQPPDTRFEGKAMLESYMDEVDAMIGAAMGEEALRNMRDAE